VRIGNDSSLTEFFDHMCSSIGTIFMVLTLCECYNIESTDVVWHYVQVGQLMILNKHLSGFKKEYISYRIFGGPGEGITLLIVTLALRGMFGLSFIDFVTSRVIEYMQTAIPAAMLQSNPEMFNDPAVKLSRTLFFWVFTYTVVNIFRLSSHNSVTKWSLMLCFMYLLVPSGLLIFNFKFSTSDIVGQGLVTAMITSDLVVARMAKRELHPWVVLISMAGLLSNLFAFILVPFYYSAVLFEVSTFTRLPLLTRLTNVYCDGIYDMPHLGHMTAFKNAAKFGTRLFVGVVNDKDATPYKRKPIMTAKEREAVVQSCKYVYNIIPDAPCEKGLLNEEFIRKHRIHIVAHGEEYNNPDDEWYAVPRRLGMTRIVPRHEGMSTSELIRRIEQRKLDELKSKPSNKIVDTD